MSAKVEVILVGVAVAAAGFWAVRAIWRTVRKGNICTSCSSSGNCPAVNNPELLQELGKIDQCGPGARQCPSKPESQPQGPVSP